MRDNLGGGAGKCCSVTRAEGRNINRDNKNKEEIQWIDLHTHLLPS